MRYLMLGAALAAVSAGAYAQAQSPWQYYEPAGGTMQAGVVSADGAQLILKCDKPGKEEVYAVVVTPDKLVPPQNADFTTRPINLRFDEEGEIEDRWRFYDNSAVAIDKKPAKSLSRLLGELVDAKKVRFRLNPERARWVEANFEVTGAKEAIDRVYASCKDTIPVQ